jgi:hypothetical protein
MTVNHSTMGEVIYESKWGCTDFNDCMALLKYNKAYIISLCNRREIIYAFYFVKQKEAVCEWKVKL